MMRFQTFTICACLLLPFVSRTQISISAVDQPVTENFNTLAVLGTSSTLPASWVFSETGMGANGTYAADAGGTNTSNTYSYGPALSTDRALGELTEPITTTFGASFINNTGVTITSLLISYTGEQWRLGTTGRTDGLNFQYSLDATSLSTGNWTNYNALDYVATVNTGAVGALDGNLDANRTPRGSIITGLNIANGATIWIKWIGFDATGDDDGVAIDDFALTANPTESYTITNAGGALTITDSDGNSESLFFSQSGTSLRLFVPGRAYRLNAGPVIAFPFTISMAALTTITVNAGTGDDIVNVGPHTTSFPSLIINGGTGDDIVNLNGDITFLSNSNIDIDLQNDDPSPGIDQVNFASNANIAVSGTGKAILNASRHINFNSGSSITSVNGIMSIEANQQSTPTAGSFAGITLAISSFIQVTGTGSLTVKGKGGNSGTAQHGIFLNGGDIIAGTSGTATIIGTGGTVVGTANNCGINIGHASSAITTSGASLNIAGTGNPLGTQSNRGIEVSQGVISTTVNGSITINAHGGISATTGSNDGIRVFNGGDILTNNGNITIVGTAGGFGTSSSNSGINVSTNATISAGGSGDIDLTGIGGVSTAVNQIGFSTGSGSSITSNNGDIAILGTAGDNTTANFAIGVFLSGGIIQAGGTHTVAVEGHGGSGTGNFNHGVYLTGNATITSTNGDVNVTGTGGGSGSISSNNYGVLVENGEISSGGSNNVDVVGTGGPSTGSNNHGVYVTTANAVITTGGGNLFISGTPGSGNSGLGFITSSNATIETASNGGSIFIATNSASIGAAIDAGINIFQIYPKLSGTQVLVGSVGDTPAGPLSLTDTELDSIFAGQLAIGSISAGTITLTANITRTNSTGVVLISADDILISGGSIHTMGGYLFLHPALPPDACKPTLAGTDAICSTMTLQGLLGININGLVADVNYTQFKISGGVNLSNASLQLTGTHIPSGGQSFTIIDNDGADPVTGTFAGLPQGATIPAFLGSPYPATISYTGGTGNDVVITVLSPHYLVTNVGGVLTLTDAAGNGESLTVSENGANIRFTVPGRTFSLNGAAIANMPVDVPLAGIDSININTAGGNDVIDFHTFIAAFPSLSLNGGTGDDAIVINGDVTFMNDANLDVNLQNDEFVPGTDQLTFNPNYNWTLLGQGNAVVKVSRNVVFNSGSSLTTVHGDLIIEANQQAVPSAGTFYGVLLASAVVEVQGSGILTVKGKGGNTGVAQIGVYLFSNGLLKGGDTGLTIIEGKGGASTSNDARGVQVQSNSVISTNGSNIQVTGIASGIGTSAFNYGIMVLSGGQIMAEGMGNVTVQGTGSLATGIRNHGILVVNTNSAITSSGGNVTVIGNAGGSGTSSYNHGIMVQNNAMISAGGLGNVTVSGFGGFPQGERNDGVICWDSNARITSSGGNVTVNGVAGGSGTSFYNPGVMLDNGGVITAGGSGHVVVNGTGGNGSGNTNYGVYVYLNGSKIQSSGTGNVTVTGIGGGNTGSQLNTGVFVFQGGEIIGGTSGQVTITGIGGSTQGTRNDGVCVQSNNSKIYSTGADIFIDGEGQGFGTGFRNYGVFVDMNSFIAAGGDGALIIDGEGASSMGIRNYGVVIAAGSFVSSFNGPINITGEGGGAGASSNNYGVYLTDGDILSAGNGTIHIEGTGGNSTGANNLGVYLLAATSTISTLNGNITIDGQGGGISTSIGNYGMLNEGTIYAGGIGNIDIDITGAFCQGGSQIGYIGIGINSLVGTENGNIVLTGHGGGTVNSTNNFGVYLLNGAKIMSGGTGQTTVIGTGGNTSGGSNMGVYIEGVNTAISSSGGNVTVNGTAGGGLGNGFNNYGVTVYNAASINAGGTGDVFVNGTGGPSTGAGNYGVVMFSNSPTILSNSDIYIVGQGGGTGTGNNNLGVHVQSTGKIIAAGTVNIQGTGGLNAGNGNHGILVWHPGTQVMSTGGAVILNGEGRGTAVSNNANGVYILDGTVSGQTVQITGEGGKGDGFFNCGIQVANPSGAITATSGDITMIGIEGNGFPSYGYLSYSNSSVSTEEGNGDIYLSANSMQILAPMHTPNSNKVVLQPLTNGHEMIVDTTFEVLGGPVMLTDAELDSIFTGTLITGNNNAGDVKIETDLTRTASTHLQFISGQDVMINEGVIDANGGNVLLDPGPSPAAVYVPDYEQDVICNNLDFGSDLKIQVNGNVPDTGYTRLHLEGTIDISGVNLVLEGTYAATFPDSFVIILNDAADAINGIFVDLPEGDTIHDFIVNDVDGVITYAGGDGNDVVIRIVNGCPQPDVPVVDASEDVICEGETVMLTIIDGDLNSATQWHWYATACGMTPIGTGLSIFVSPDTTTTYYVRGEGGCATNATCGTKVVTVTPHPDASIQRSFSSPCYYTNNTFQPMAAAIPGAVYTWNFGANANPASATGYGPHEVQYTTGGTKNVKLVIHPNGIGTSCADSTILTFTIDNCPGQITGRVVDTLDNPIINVNVKLFVDADANGIPDSIGPIRNVFTSNQGTFSMASLIPGSYLIIQTQPNNWVSFDDGDLTPDGDVLANLDSLDNIIPATIGINKIDSNNVFFEIAAPGSILGNVFDDLNLNMAPDPGEGIQNVTIKLFADANANGVADSGTPVATTTTTASGAYTFLNIPTGNYVIVESTPLGWISIKDYDPTADGDIVPNTNMNNDTIPVTLLSNESDADNLFIDGPTCNLVVSNSNDAGPGSLRNAINCAINGDTILFGAGMAGQNISVTSGIIQINKQIVVHCTFAPRVTVSSEIDGLFQVLEDGDVEFINLSFISGLAPPGAGAAIENTGILRLNNVSVLKNEFALPGSYLIKNVIPGQVFTLGQTQLNID